jgi:hypothetical protein
MTIPQKRKNFGTGFALFLEKIEGAKKGPKEKYNPAAVSPKADIIDAENILPIKRAVEALSSHIAAKSEEECNKKIDDLLSEQSGKNVCCDSVFGLFAIYCSKYVSQDFFEELLIFLALYREVLNDKGWEKLEMLTGPDGPKPQGRVFCECSTPEVAPDLSNPFIVEYFPQIGGTGSIVKKTTNLKFLGIDDKKLSWVIGLIKHFCNWLNINKFSEGVVEVKKDNT